MMILFQPTMLLSLTFLLFLSFRVRLLYWRLIYSPPDFRKKPFNLFEIFGKCCKAFECCCWGYICIEATRERQIIVWDTRRMFFFFFIPAEKTHSARWERQIPLGPLTPMKIEKENGKRSEFCLCITAGIYIFFYVKIFLLTVTKFSWIYSALCTSHGLISPDSGTSYYSWRFRGSRMFQWPD